MSGLTSQYPPPWVSQALVCRPWSKGPQLGDRREGRAGLESSLDMTEMVETTTGYCIAGNFHWCKFLCI